MTRKPLNKPIRRAVQCRDQSVVDRLHDRSHPNKVSMKKKEKKRKEREECRYLYPGGTALVVSESLPVHADWQVIHVMSYSPWLGKQRI